MIKRDALMKELTPSPVSMNHRPWKTKYQGELIRHTFAEYALILFTLILIPIDWFVLTGELFRELGAKPAILLLSAVATMTLLVKVLNSSKFKFSRLIRIESLFILLLGFFAFCISIFRGAYSFSTFKDPVFQFIAQEGILALFFFVVFFYTDYCKTNNRRYLFIQLLPWAAAVHLTVYLFETFDFINDHEGWLLMFRFDGGVIERATGLMSEPSYYGTFAALFGTPLLIMKCFNKYYYRVLGALIVLTAFVINAKTMFIVISFQILFYVFFMRIKASKINLLIGLFALVFGGLTMNASQKPLDVNENLSSAMRIGSTVLGLNLAMDGYGLSGVGAGQFHFFYKEVYAPSFLFLSDEASNQFKSAAENRASTYNLFVRLLVETGFVGLLLFMDIIRRALISARVSDDPTSQFAVLLISGSIGFLMTQDTYFYPPLVLGLALAFSSHRPTLLRKNDES